MKFAFDDNLGLPGDFAQRLGCELVSFHELDQMLSAFAGGDVDAMFAPCGALPYINAPYDIIAQATFGPARGHVMSSLFRIPSGAAGDESLFLRGRIACVNPYCTTSYWAPMIALLERTPEGSPVNFFSAAGFDDMLFAAVDGRADGAMVWTAVADKHPDAAAKTRVLFQIDGLPTPVILARPSLDTAQKQRMRDTLASYQAADGGFFNGFSAPEVSMVEQFHRQCVASQQHYRLTPPSALG